MGKKNKKTERKTTGVKQHRHNPGTKGLRTKKLGPLWAIRQYNSKDENGVDRISSYEVRVPVRAMWNSDLISSKQKELGLPEPFDSLYLEWADELRDYAEENTSTECAIKIERTPISNDKYRYEVIKVFVDKEIDDEILLTVESSFNHNFGPTGKFKKKRG